MRVTNNVFNTHQTVQNTPGAFAERREEKTSTGSFTQVRTLRPIEVYMLKIPVLFSG